MTEWRGSRRNFQHVGSCAIYLCRHRPWTVRDHQSGDISIITVDVGRVNFRIRAPALIGPYRHDRREGRTAHGDVGPSRRAPVKRNSTLQQHHQRGWYYMLAIPARRTPVRKNGDHKGAALSRFRRFPAPLSSLGIRTVHPYNFITPVLFQTVTRLVVEFLDLSVLQRGRDITVNG